MAVHSHKTQELGAARIPLQALLMQNTIEGEYPVVNCNGQLICNVSLIISFFNIDTHRFPNHPLQIAIQSKQVDGEVDKYNVWIENGQHIYYNDCECNPFVRMIWVDGRTYTTPYIIKSCSPVWNFHLSNLIAPSYDTISTANSNKTIQFQIFNKVVEEDDSIMIG